MAGEPFRTSAGHPEGWRYTELRHDAAIGARSGFIYKLSVTGLG
jgi:hypothetical protein